MKKNKERILSKTEVIQGTTFQAGITVKFDGKVIYQENGEEKTL